MVCPAPSRAGGKRSLPASSRLAEAPAAADCESSAAGASCASAIDGVDGELAAAADAVCAAVAAGAADAALLELGGEADPHMPPTADAGARQRDGASPRARACSVEVSAPNPRGGRSIHSGRTRRLFRHPLQERQSSGRRIRPQFLQLQGHHNVGKSVRVSFSTIMRSSAPHRS